MVLHRGDVFTVITGSCEECSMMDARERRCRGYCYRWPDMENLVFRFVGIEEYFPSTHIVCVSEDTIGRKIDEIKRLKNYHYVLKGRAGR